MKTIKPHPRENRYYILLILAGVVLQFQSLCSFYCTHDEINVKQQILRMF